MAHTAVIITSQLYSIFNQIFTNSTLTNYVWYPNALSVVCSSFTEHCQGIRGAYSVHYYCTVGIRCNSDLEHCRRTTAKRCAFTEPNRLSLLDILTSLYITKRVATNGHRGNYQKLPSCPNNFIWPIFVDLIYDYTPECHKWWVQTKKNPLVPLAALFCTSLSKRWLVVEYAYQ